MYLFVRASVVESLKKVVKNSINSLLNDDFCAYATGSVRYGF